MKDPGFSWVLAVFVVMMLTLAVIFGWIWGG